MLGQRDLRAKASMQCLFGLVNEPYFILFSSIGFNFKVLILGAWGLRPTYRLGRVSLLLLLLWLLGGGHWLLGSRFCQPCRRFDGWPLLLLLLWLRRLLGSCCSLGLK